MRVCVCVCLYNLGMGRYEPFTKWDPQVSSITSSQASRQVRRSGIGLGEDVLKLRRDDFFPLPPVPLPQASWLVTVKQCGFQKRWCHLGIASLHYALNCNGAFSCLLPLVVI